MDLSQSEQSILQLNRQAMQFLKTQQFLQSKNCLKQAQSFSFLLPNQHLRSRLLGITYNNFGCYYKHKKQLKVALQFLNKALYFQNLFDTQKVNLASTHLNISALYSSLKRHQKAFTHSQTALKILKESAYSIQQQTNLIISHFNVGVQLEQMNRVNQALDYYRNGWDIAVKQLGVRHPLAENIASTFRAAQSRADYFNGVLQYRQHRRNNSRVCPHKVNKKFIQHLGVKNKKKFPKKFCNKRRSASPHRDLDYKLPPSFFRPPAYQTEVSSPNL